MGLFKLKSQSGFSFLETILAGGVSAILIFGGTKILTQTMRSEKTTSAQSLIDREFAAGAQIAANAKNITGSVNPSLLDNCLIRDNNAGCGVHGTWRDYPAGVAPNRPTFQTTVSLQGECTDENDPRCVVKRRMRYRWICTNTECSGLETEVRVTPLGKYAASAKERITNVKLDRRQFFSRAQIEFLCGTGANENPILQVSYDQLRDICQDGRAVSCSTLAEHYTPGNPTDSCRDPLASDCYNGYVAGAMDSDRIQCIGPPAGRTVAGRTDTTAPPYYVPTPAGIRVTNTRTETATATVANTSVVTGPTTPAPCVTTGELPGSGYYRIPSGGVYYYNGVDAYCGFSSPEHFQRYANNPNPPYTNVSAMPTCKRDDGACPDPGSGGTGGGSGPEMGAWGISRNDFSPSPPYEDCGPSGPIDPFWAQPCVKGRYCRYWNRSGFWDIMQCG